MTNETFTTDPMTGEPWTLCGVRVTTVSTPHILPDGSKSYARRAGCRQPVTVNERGVWVYAK